MLSSDLLGRWELVSTKPDADFGDRVQMEFASSGGLTYGSLEGSTWQLMFLTFRVEEGGKLVTSQPSAPREERTAFSFLENGKLELMFGDVLCTLERVEQLAFEDELHHVRN